MGRTMTAQRVNSARFAGLALLALGPFLAGCGHRATVEECEEIVERVARLELEKRMPGDPEGVAAEIEKTKAELRETTMKDCVGKRVTDSAMQCVRNAKSSKEIVETCFD